MFRRGSAVLPPSHRRRGATAVLVPHKPQWQRALQQGCLTGNFGEPLYFVKIQHGHPMCRRHIITFFLNNKARCMRNTIFSYKPDLRNSFRALFMWSEVKLKVKCRSITFIKTQCIILFDFNDYMDEINYDYKGDECTLFDALTFNQQNCQHQ